MKTTIPVYSLCSHCLDTYHDDAYDPISYCPLCLAPATHVQEEESAGVNWNESSNLDENDDNEEDFAEESAGVDWNESPNRDINSADDSSGGDCIMPPSKKRTQ